MPTHQHLATGFEIGTRFHSAPVLRASDAKPLHLGHVVEADGRWRLFVFADQDGAAASSALAQLCTLLTEDPRSPITRYAPNDVDIDAVIDVRTILQTTHEEATSAAVPMILRPTKGWLGLVDYQKVFVPDPKADDIYDLRGVSRTEGAMVLVRPDQHVATVLPLDGYDALAEFFAAFMIERVVA